MNTITPERVKAAFEKTHVEPIRGKWIEWADDDESRDDREVVACCAMTALVLAEKDDVRNFTMTDLDDWDADNAAAEFGELFNLSEHYLKGFVDGWDGHHPSEIGAPVLSNDYQLGHEHGEAAWDKVAWSLISYEEEDDA
jgi:hypothetical protein